jgi:phenylalanyl-tRNA synthetase alpha chain
MLEELEALEEKALAELENVSSQDELDEWRQQYLGRRGELTLLLRNIGKLPPDKRPIAGRESHRVQNVLEEGYEARSEVLQQEELAALMAEERIDVSLPGRPVSNGRLHVITRTLRRILEIFSDMGFQVEEWREVETDEYNFQLLNIPPYHPARDMWSTFHTTKEGVVLRTHTSPGQIHTMRQYYPEPIRVVLPGRVYRYEQVTARAESMFYQVEGLAVGENITLADLKGVLFNFAKRMYDDEDIQARFRFDYFPFTEPSIEMDIRCFICAGEGCRICKYTGWLEILGAGMVHPNVLRNGGYDPDVFSGFAFGMGPERIAMLKHRVDDIRYFYGNDLRFLRQFG